MNSFPVLAPPPTNAPTLPPPTPNPTNAPTPVPVAPPTPAPVTSPQPPQEARAEDDYPIFGKYTGFIVVAIVFLGLLFIFTIRMKYFMGEYVDE